MKKILAALLIAGGLTLGLSACGTGGYDTSDTKPTIPASVQRQADKVAKDAGQETHKLVEDGKRYVNSPQGQHQIAQLKQATKTAASEAERAIKNFTNGYNK